VPPQLFVPCHPIGFPPCVPLAPRVSPFAFPFYPQIAIEALNSPPLSNLFSQFLGLNYPPGFPFLCCPPFLCSSTQIPFLLFDTPREGFSQRLPSPDILPPLVPSTYLFRYLFRRVLLTHIVLDHFQPLLIGFSARFSTPTYLQRLFDCIAP